MKLKGDMEKNKAGKGDRVWGWGCMMTLLFWIGQSGKSLTEKVTFEQKEVQVSHAYIWGRSAMGREAASTKAWGGCILGVVKGQRGSQCGGSRVCNAWVWGCGRGDDG